MTLKMIREANEMVDFRPHRVGWNPPSLHSWTKRLNLPIFLLPWESVLREIWRSAEDDDDDNHDHDDTDDDDDDDEREWFAWDMVTQLRWLVARGTRLLSTCSALASAVQSIIAVHLRVLHFAVHCSKMFNQCNLLYWKPPQSFALKLSRPEHECISQIGCTSAQSVQKQRY